MSKYNPSFDVTHIGELAKIDKTLQERGESDGIRPYVVELIARLTSGGVAGKSDDIRTTQAKRLWDAGSGRELELATFADYFATIPEIPASLKEEDAELPFLSLADPRLGLMKACRLLGVQFEGFGYADEDAIPFDHRFMLPTEPFWFRHDDGRKHRGLRPDHCREASTETVLTGTALIGLMAWAHHPYIVEHVIDLPGTVLRSCRGRCAYLGIWSGRPELGLFRSAGVTRPRYGSLRFRRK